jgi:hypothetical protein
MLQSEILYRMIYYYIRYKYLQNDVIRQTHEKGYFLQIK